MNPAEALTEKRPVPLEAYTIEQFCEAYQFSHTSFFKMKKAGRGPREIRVGKRVILTRQAIADWCRERETEAV